MAFFKQEFNSWRSPPFAVIFLAFVFLIFFHIIATIFYLYWLYWWLDTVMHLLGGFWTALAAVWLFQRSDFFVDLTFGRKFFIILSSVLLVAVLWELFELFLGNVDPSMGSVYWIDTAGDIVAGLLGGSFAVVFRPDI